MFLIESLVKAARIVSTLLDLFVDFSGLNDDHTKSAFMGFEPTQDEELQCSEALATLIGSLAMRYLGLP